MSNLTEPYQNDSGQRILDFDENRLLSPLYGAHNNHLARIEQMLDVTIVTQGNRVFIRGGKDASEQAVAVLNGLYKRLKDGESLDQGDVDGALRMVGRTPGLGHAGTSSDGNGRAVLDIPVDSLKIVTRNKVIQPRSLMQARYVAAMKKTLMTFGVGPAGTGKTYLAVAMAVEKMLSGEVDRIILSRPAVEAGENLGFLPGDLKEKVDPYLRPLYDALYDMLPGDQVEKRLFTGQIEVAPLAYMRGRTLANSYVILDEAQNTTPMQMKMFLTRFGENSWMTICGDPSQVDLPPATKSGLSQALEILSGVDGVSIVTFTEKDVVRHPLVARIVAAYDTYSQNESDKDSGR